MKILVTGGAGFVGSRVAEFMLQAGHDVTVFDNLTTGHAASVPEGAALIEADLRDATAVREAVKGCEAVVNLAAQALVPESVANPQKAFDINLTGGFNVLEAMRAEGVQRIVHSSTAAVYGNPVRVPIHEDDPKQPINPYGSTKLAYEALLHSYHAAYGFHVTMFRYFNPYGPHEVHEPETHAIPNFIKAALNGTPVPLFWKGEPIRDFFFVDDIARAHVMGLDRDGYNIYNLGSGDGVKVADVVEKIFEISGSRSTIDDLGERPGDPMLLFADTTRARDELGWKPEVSIDEGLRITIEAFRNRHS